MKLLKSALLLSMGFFSMNIMANENLVNEIDNKQVEEKRYIIIDNPFPEFLQRIKYKYQSKFEVEFVYDKTRFKKDIGLMSIDEINAMNCKSFELETDSFTFFPYDVQKGYEEINNGFLIKLKKEKIGFYISYIKGINIKELKYQNNKDMSYFYYLSDKLKRLYELKQKYCRVQKDLIIKNHEKEQQLKVWEERSK